MKLKLLKEAQTEYEEAVDYYIDRSEIAARAFVHEFDLALRTIVASPDRWRVDIVNTRIYRLPNFPYSLYYGLLNDEIVLVAVAHHRRRPAYWQERS